jgi:hypothetical protein
MNQTVLAKGKRAVPLFEGSLTVRIHEADGAPFEHVPYLRRLNPLEVCGNGRQHDLIDVYVCTLC